MMSVCVCGGGGWGRGGVRGGGGGSKYEGSHDDPAKPHHLINTFAILRHVL